jgi:hypothetical protein
MTSTSAPRNEAQVSHPFKLFTMEEAAAALEVSVKFIRAMKREGAPFPGGRTRLEWLLEWLKDHPEWDPKLS